MNGRRLLIVNHGVPDPSRGASHVLFFYYIQALQRLGLETLNVLLLDPSNSTPEALEEYRQRFAHTPNMTVWALTAATYQRSTMFSSELDLDALAPALQRIAAFEPDLIFCLDFFSASVVNRTISGDAARKTVWLGDLAFETSWYHSLYALKEAQYRSFTVLLQFLQNAIRSRVIKASYARELSRFHRIIASSKSGEHRLRAIGIESTYLPYPWPEEPATGAIGGLPRKPTFLFLGTLSGLGSRSAFHFMSGRFYQRLVEVWGPDGFRILITGARTLPAWVRAMIADKPEFDYRGFVDDMTALMGSCHGVIVPIDVPVGNRSRIVTAMANGAVVVAHENTALGNPDLVHGDTCLLARTAEQFTAAMKSVVDDRSRAEAIARRARACYERTFAPAAACERLLAEILKP